MSHPEQAFTPAPDPNAVLAYEPLPEYGPLWFTAADLGMPPKFAQFRPQQAHAISAALYTGTRFLTLCMPTGSGKSAIPATISAATGQRVVILTRTKALQAQYMRDFASIGLVDVRGRNNFPCASRWTGEQPVPVDQTCESGAEHDCPHAHDKDNCPYSKQFHQAQHARLVVTNYSYFCLIQQQDANLAAEHPIDWIVMDEAHDSDTAICEAASIEIRDEHVHGVLRTRWPDNRQECTLADWGAWAAAVHPSAVKMLDRLARLKQDAKAGVGAWTPLDQKRFRELERAAGLLSSIIYAANEGPEKWVCETPYGSLRITPVWASNHAENLIYNHGKRILLLSATIVKRTLHYLGIPEDENSIFLEYPSPFDPNRSPIYYIPGIRVTASMKQEDWETLVSRIDWLIENRSDRRIIIPSVSYQRAQDIKRDSRFGSWIVVHDGRSTAAAVEWYLQQAPPVILASPAIDTGWDFPDDACRLIIIPKHPTLDTRSPLEAARDAQDKLYKHYRAAVKLAQTVGRAMRWEGDWCEIVLLDTISAQHLFNQRRFYPKFLPLLVRRGAPPPRTPQVYGDAR